MNDLLLFTTALATVVIVRVLTDRWPKLRLDAVLSTTLGVGALLYKLLAPNHVITTQALFYMAIGAIFAWGANPTLFRTNLRLAAVRGLSAAALALLLYIVVGQS